MPESNRLAAALSIYQRRLRLASAASALLVGAVAAAVVCVVSNFFGMRAWEARALPGIAFTVIATALTTFWWPRWTAHRTAAIIESRVKDLDNLVVTAEEVLNKRGGVIHAVVKQSLFHEALVRVQSLAPRSVQPLGGPFLLALLALVAAAVVIIAVPRSPAARSQRATSAIAAAAEPLEPRDVRVVVTPPSYTGQAPSASLNPTEIVVIEGSRVRLEAAATGGRRQLAQAGREPVAFSLANDRWSYEFQATESQVLLIQQSERASPDADRLLQVRVNADRRPLVRIRAPAKDLIFGEPRGQVAIEMEARDDLGLRSLALRYTRVAGSGETFTFEEGEVPVRIQRTNAGEWRGQATLTLDRFKLEDGDTLVYRAIATDGKPGADPSASDAFLIEIGRLAGAASTGFAVPEERDRQAISQQMLIIKTERLHAERSSLGQEAYAEQARLLAVEQRMVKAEFVFMTGGEVEDEVEEAERADELAEGRFENAAQVELLTAIREMSRAEARLNAADTGQALIFERAALRALQRAFDRRRYLLRTLPERTRIDLARRLTGDRPGGPFVPRPTPGRSADAAVATARQVMRDLGAAVAGRQGLNAALASRVLAVDPGSNELQKAATALASGPTLDARMSAAREAQQDLADFVSSRLRAGPRDRVVQDPLVGRFADESARLRGRQ